MCHLYINPCAAELFLSIFHSFEVGILLAIPSSNDKNKILLLENGNLSN